MKITVDPKRKSVYVLNWGSPPFAIDDENKVIPNGFQVRTKCNKKWWIATARVNQHLIADYQFICESNPEDGTGDFLPSPTGAFENVNGPNKLNDLRYHKGTNGALLIGVKYPALQEQIRLRFSGEDSFPSLPTRETRPAGNKRQKMEEPKELEPELYTCPTVPDAENCDKGDLESLELNADELGFLEDFECGVLYFSRPQSFDDLPPDCTDELLKLFE